MRAHDFRHRSGSTSEQINTGTTALGTRMGGGGERVQSRSSAGHAQLFVANSSLTRMCANLWILVVGLASRRPSGSVCPDAFAQRIRLLPQAFYHRAER